MKTIDQWLIEYGESHQNRVNKSIHWICVPVIMFTVLAFFWSIPHGYMNSLLPGTPGRFLNWATVVAILAGLFYLRLSFMMFLGMMAIAAGMLIGIDQLEQAALAPLWLIAAVVFVVAWIGQFIGHHIEGKKPSFFKDLQFLLIGPAWLLGYVYRRLGIRYA